MPEPTPISNAFERMSVSRLATPFGVSRATVTARLQQAGVVPSAVQAGNPVYRLRDAASAIVGKVTLEGDAAIDPRALPPVPRNAWYQSELRRVEFEKQCGQLIPAQDFEREIARMAKGIARFLDTLPDVLERDAGLDGGQVEYLEEILARERLELYKQLRDDDDEEGFAG